MTNIKVAIRIRPLIDIEKENKLCVQWGTQNNLIFQADENGHKCGETYSFDHIFGIDRTNLDIYNDIVKDFVDSCLQGLNSTIFAYGQTSSGKTYTMLGDKKNTGLMSLAIENIFTSIENNSNRKYLLRVSYIEIYNEKINDLLDPANKDVKIREFYPATIGLQNIKEEIVSTEKQMFDCLKKGNLNRRIAATKANDRSSRSHTIFKIVIESTQIGDFEEGSGCVQVSNLNLVDLAGSERVAQTKATGVRLKEGGHINKSLSALGLVIKQLSDGQEFVNFRDSKLTRLLQDSLGGNSKTLIIATITLASLEESSSTLAFAQRAKTVKNKPQVNEILTDADLSKRYAALNTQLQKKFEEQLCINQKLEQTTKENNREIEWLQQQMEILKNFQHRQSTPKIDNIPKRRHTIGFSAQKQLFPRDLSNYKKSDQDSNNAALPMKDITISVTTLDTIVETKFPENKSSNPKSNFSVDYGESTIMVNPEELTELENPEEEQECDQCKIREEELGMIISDLEEKLKEKKEKDDDVDVAHIMEQLICLQKILKNAAFVNGPSEPKEENSVLQIIEKFNVKVKTSKDIIENEILIQINNFNQSSQEQIILPNELASFNGLLNELLLFESDIPVDLIDSMKREGVEDLKILIKIYESLLRKNELIGLCSEKIKLLEEENKNNQEEINNLSKALSEKITEITEMKIRIEESDNNCAMLKEEKENSNKKCASENIRLKEEISEKNLIICELQRKTEELMHNSEVNDLRTQLLKIQNKMEDERKDNENLLKATKQDMEKLQKENERLHVTVTKLNHEKTEMKMVIEESDNNCAMLKEEKENANKKCASENIRLKEEISEKDQIICEFQRKNEELMHNREVSNLRTQLLEDERKDNEILLKATKQDIEKLQKENFDILCKNTELTEENERLNVTFTKLNHEITEMRMVIEESDNNCAMLKEEKENTNKKFAYVSSENIRLKEEISEKNQIIYELQRKNKELMHNSEANNLRTQLLDIQNKMEDERKDNENLLKATKQDIEKLQKENFDILCKSKELTEENERLNVTFTKLNHEITEMRMVIEESDNNCAMLKEEKENTNKKFAYVSSENIRLKEELSEKNQIICELQRKNKELMHNSEANNLRTQLLDIQNKVEDERKDNENLLKATKQDMEKLQKENFDILCKSKELSEENERLKVTFTQLNHDLHLENDYLKAEIRKLNSTVEDYQRINKHTDLKVQKQKQLLDNAHTQMNDLRQEKETLKSENDQYKSKLEEYTRCNANNCDKNVSLERVIKEQEILVNVKKKLEDALSAITEHFINEQKAIMLIKHSQDQREHFKNVVRDIKLSNTILKNQFTLLQNQRDCDLKAISDNLIKYNSTLKEYFRLEKTFMQTQIDHLESNNNAYLHEIMALRDKTQCANSTDCGSCNSLKSELARLKEQEKKLKKENFESMKRIVDLQNRMYKEQDERAEVQYTDLLRFYQEDNRSLQRQVDKLQEQIKKSAVNKQSVESQCNILQLESSMQEKYNKMKKLCIMRRDEILSLQSENSKLRENQEQARSAKMVSVEVQCDSLNTEKYNSTKRVCKMRADEIAQLKATIHSRNMDIVALQNKIKPT